MKKSQKNYQTCILRNLSLIKCSIIILILFTVLGGPAKAFHLGNIESSDPQHLNISSPDNASFTLFDKVFHLNKRQSEALFSSVTELSLPSTEEENYTLQFNTRQEELNGLQVGNILAAASDGSQSLQYYQSDWSTWRWLTDHGLLHFVVSMEETESGWKLELQRATLADAIEEGTLLIEASMLITSTVEGFDTEPDEHQPRWQYRPVSQHHDIEHCAPGQFPVQLQNGIQLGDYARADVEYSAVLHLKHELTFSHGQLEHADLGAKICQSGSLQLTSEQEVGNTWLLWEHRGRAKWFRVGLLPIVARIGGSLEYSLELSGQLSNSYPLIFTQRLQGGAQLSNGDWNHQRPNWAPPTLKIPHERVNFSVQHTSTLLPKLEVMLYGVAGPYIQGTGAATLGVNELVEPTMDAALVLHGGIQQNLPIATACRSGDCEISIFGCRWEWDFMTQTWTGQHCARKLP